MSLTERTIRAAQWRSASYLLQGILQFGVGIILARLLPPADFGLAALAMIVVGLAGILAEVGLTPALVYHRPLTERHIRFSLTVSIIVASVLASGMFVLAPYAAAPFRNESLPAVLRVEALLLVFTAPGVTALALLRRRLDFGRLFVIEGTSYIVGYGVVAVALALLDRGVWSLVFGALAQAGLATAMALVMVRHPIRPLLAIEEGRHLFTYGSAATLNAIINYTARVGDLFVVGRWLGASALGLYSRASHLISTPLAYLGNTTTGVLFPAMSEIQHDVPRLRTAYLFGVQITVLLAGPICAGMVVAAPHLIVGLYGEEWREAAVPLQILAIAGIFRAVSRVAAAVTYGSGNVMAEARRQLAFTLLVVTGGIIGSSGGVAGVSLGVACAIVFMYFAMSHLSLRIVGGEWRDFLVAHLSGLVLSMLVASVAYSVRSTLEDRGVPSIWIVAGIVTACAVSLPIGVFLMPHRLRPVTLFARFSAPISRLPKLVRAPLSWMFRLEA